MDLHDQLNGAVSATTSSSSAAKVPLAAHLIWFVITCVGSAVVSVGTYVAGLATDKETSQMETRLGQRIDNVENRLDLLIPLVVDIAKTVGVKQNPASASTSQPK